MDDKTFVDMGYITGTDRIEDGRGLVAVDIENDGDLDLAVVNYLERATLLVNQGTPGHHWLELKLAGAGPQRGGSNRSAIGARVSVTAGGRRFSRQVVCSGGYLSGFTTSLHIGLGTAAAIDDVEIHWPSGRVQRITDLPIDRKHRIEEPVGAPSTASAR